MRGWQINRHVTNLTQPTNHSRPIWSAKDATGARLWGDVPPAIRGWPSIVLDALIDKWLLPRTKNKRTGMHQEHGGNSALCDESSREV